MTLLRSIFLRREAGILVMIVVFCVAVGLYKPHFLSGQSLRIILLLTPLIMILMVSGVVVNMASRV